MLFVNLVIFSYSNGAKIMSINIANVTTNEALDPPVRYTFKMNNVRKNFSTYKILLKC